MTRGQRELTACLDHMTMTSLHQGLLVGDPEIFPLSLEAPPPTLGRGAQGQEQREGWRKREPQEGEVQAVGST